jgi:hypothetical protein
MENNSVRSVSKSVCEEIFKYIRINKAALLKTQYFEQFPDLKQSLSTYKDSLTRMTMLRYSIHFKSFEVTALLLDYATGSELLDKEVYYDAVDSADPTVCTTVLHLLIDEKQPIMIEKFFNLFKTNERFLPYVMRKKKCFVTVIESNVDFVEYLTSFEYAALRGQQNIVSLYCQYCPCLLGSPDMCKQCTTLRYHQQVVRYCGIHPGEGARSKRLALLGKLGNYFNCSLAKWICSGCRGLL